jgi:cytoskeletal protein CcmA (bactofilin family)
MQPQDENQLDSLEEPATTVEKKDQTDQPTDEKKKKRPKLSIKALIAKLNIYFLLFVLVLVIAAGIVFIGIQQNKKVDQAAEIDFGTQPLTEEQLQQIRDSDAKVGDPKQTLSIESNADFKGRVLVRDSLDVAGTIRVGGSLSLPGITVSGTSNFDQIQANNLSIAGDTNIQGQLTVQETLTVTGGASFGGPISAPSLAIQTLQINGDLQINRHIDAGGPTPSIARGGAVGSGGTATVSGTDTAGTITINAGGGAGNGQLATITFANNFSQTPHITITPVGRYVQLFTTRTTTGFTVHAVGGVSAGSFSIDYIAID